MFQSQQFGPHVQGAVVVQHLAILDAVALQLDHAAVIGRGRLGDVRFGLGDIVVGAAVGKHVDPNIRTFKKQALDVDLVAEEGRPQVNRHVQALALHELNAFKRTGAGNVEPFQSDRQLGKMAEHGQVRVFKIDRGGQIFIGCLFDARGNLIFKQVGHGKQDPDQEHKKDGQSEK